MPLYQAHCNVCAHPFEYVASIDECLIVPPCPACAGVARKVIRTAPKGFVRGVKEPFWSPVDGTIIHNDRELREHNQRNGVVQLGEGFDEATILNPTPAPPVRLSATERQRDLAESIQQVREGYQPARQTLDEEATRQVLAMVTPSASFS